MLRGVSKERLWCQCRVAVKNCALLGYKAVYDGYSSPTFRDNLSVTSSRVLKVGPIGRLDRSVRNYHSTLHNNPEDSRSHLPRGGSLETCIRSQVKEENTLTWFQRISQKKLYIKVYL